MDKYERLERLRLKYERKKSNYDKMIDLITLELEEMRLKDKLNIEG